jgi:hypothetical protein
MTGQGAGFRLTEADRERARRASLLARHLERDDRVAQANAYRALGWPTKKIARTMGLRPETVRQYLSGKASGCAPGLGWPL